MNTVEYIRPQLVSAPSLPQIGNSKPIHYVIRHDVTGGSARLRGMVFYDDVRGWVTQLIMTDSVKPFASSNRFDTQERAQDWLLAELKSQYADNVSYCFAEAAVICVMQRADRSIHSVGLVAHWQGKLGFYAKEETYKKQEEPDFTEDSWPAMHHRLSVLGHS